MAIEHAELAERSSGRIPSAARAGLLGDRSGITSWIDVERPRSGTTTVPTRERGNEVFRLTGRQTASSGSYSRPIP